MKGIEPNYNNFRPQPKKEKVEKVYKGINKMSDKAKAKKDEKKSDAIELHKYCLQWYEEHPTKRCYECDGRILIYTKMNCHHLIPKKDQDKYSVDLTLNTDNMVLLCLQDHSKCETNIDHAPRTKELTEQTYKAFEKYLI